MDLDRWQRISEIFEVLSVESAETWQSRLLTLCPEDAQLREEVLAMLKNAPQASARLDAIVDAARNSSIDDDDADLPDRIGPFELVREIGRAALARSGLPAAWKVALIRPLPSSSSSWVWIRGRFCASFTRRAVSFLCCSIPTLPV